MSQSLISLLLNAWLVVATVFFVAIVWLSFRPSARARMERHARIPFEGKAGEP